MKERLSSHNRSKFPKVLPWQTNDFPADENADADADADGNADADDDTLHEDGELDDPGESTNEIFPHDSEEGGGTNRNVKKAYKINRLDEGRNARPKKKPKMHENRPIIGNSSDIAC